MTRRTGRIVHLTAAGLIFANVLAAAACDSGSELAPSVTEAASVDPTTPPTPAAHGTIPPSVKCQWAIVASVTDGDTIRVNLEGGEKNVAVRYIGMDTPETKKPATPVQPYGREAAKSNEALVLKQRLCLERDVSETDRYDRLLRIVWREDGVMVNEALVLEGLAVLDTVPPDVRYVETFRAAQASARERGLGVWSPGP